MDDCDHILQNQPTWYTNSITYLQLNKFLCFQTFRLDAHKISRRLHALLALKAEVSGTCVASGGSKCSFSSFEGGESKASVTTMAPIGSTAFFYQKNFPETCTCYTLPPNKTGLLHVRALWKFGTAFIKLPVLFLWMFLPRATAAAFVTTCCLLTALAGPKPGPTRQKGLITKVAYIFSVAAHEPTWIILIACP